MKVNLKLLIRHFVVLVLKMKQHYVSEWTGVNVKKTKKTQTTNKQTKHPEWELADKPSDDWSRQIVARICRQPLETVSKHDLISDTPSQKRCLTCTKPSGVRLTHRDVGPRTWESGGHVTWFRWTQAEHAGHHEEEHAVWGPAASW